MIKCRFCTYEPPTTNKNGEPTKTNGVLDRLRRHMSKEHPKESKKYWASVGSNTREQNEREDNAATILGPPSDREDTKFSNFVRTAGNRLGR